MSSSCTLRPSGSQNKRWNRICGRREQACTAPCTRIAARRTRLAESPSRIIYAVDKLPSPIDA